MKSAWSAVDGGFHFSTGALAGVLQANASRQWTVRIGDVGVGAVQALSWKLESDGSVGVVKPTPAAAYIQQPYVVVPFDVKSSSDLRLTAFFRATDQGIDVDYRLATVAPLDDVVLQVDGEWKAGAFRLVPNLAPATFPGVSVGLLNHSKGQAAIFIDVGEHGAFALSDSGATLRMFNQSLEKGVILVGRFAIRPNPDPETMKHELQQWLEHPSASL